MKRSLAISIFAHGLFFTALFYVADASIHLLGGRPGAPGVMWLASVGVGSGSIGKAAPPTTRQPQSQVEARKVKGTIPAPESTEQSSEGQGETASSGISQGSAGTVGAGGSGGGGGDYVDPRLLVIRRKLEEAKRYPALALRQGIQGTTRVRFRIDEKGVPVETQILESSGSRLLDEATLRTVEKASPLPVVSGWVTFPLHFDLHSPWDS